MAASDMKEQAKEVGKHMQEKAGQVGEQIKTQTSQLTGQAQTKVKTTLEEQKGKGVGELSNIAEAVRQTGQHLRDQQKDGIAQYAERAADQMDRLIRYVDSRDVSELLSEAEIFARRHPEAFLGGAFMMGLVAGRFIKSSKERRVSEYSSRQEQTSPTASSLSAPV
ncbi:MAG TPA: hypothetical protein PKK23_02060 [Nitrospirales bacterium]|nr:hypothetical protein [Nitrospiraceae bacterium]HNP27800.1 hypothetical protein [Nitrospirales bacterium]